MKQFASLSDGRVYEAKNSFNKRQVHLTKLQRRLSKKKKGSSNSNKLKQRINKLHTKIANIRQNCLQQVSTDISKNHALVVLEDLKVASMSKSASGTIEHPGTLGAVKSGLNRSILDQGWHSFKSMLSYKLNHLGGELLVVDRCYTPQKCSTCGHTEKENRMSQAQFACVQWGHSENADINAANTFFAALISAFSRQHVVEAAMNAM